MKRRLTWYDFHVGDYRADTRHLTRTEHFAYREILDEIFWTGQEHDPPSIPDDDAALRRLTRCESADEWQAMREVLIDGTLLCSEDGRVSQKRMTTTIRRAFGISAQKRSAARARWDRADACEEPETAPQVTTAPKNGNGNGHMSRGQYLYKAGEVNKWRSESSWKYVGSADNSMFEKDFRATFGMSWQQWKAEIEHQASS